MLKHTVSILRIVFTLTVILWTLFYFDSYNPTYFVLYSMNRGSCVLPETFRAMHMYIGIHNHMAMHKHTYAA